MYDKEISHYNVIVYKYNTKTKKYRKIGTFKRNTDDEAVQLAREWYNKPGDDYAVKVQQVYNIVGWWYS